VPALLLALALTVAASQEREHEPPTEPAVEAPVQVEGWHFAGVPLVSYGSDVGLTLGGALFFYKPVPSGEMHAISIGASYATRGPKSLDVNFGFVRLLGTSLRTHLNLHLGDDDQMPYWGEGARLGGLDVPPGFGTPPEPYRYHDRRVYAAVVLRGGLLGPLGWHLRARWLDVGVPEQSALLAASSPPGARGGRVSLGEVGLLWDSRDRELATRSGVFATVAAFAAPELSGVSDFAFHGWNASARVYVPLWLGTTLAVRGLYDDKISGVPRSASAHEAVPFFERMLYEGITFNDGFGSASTIRGIARYRVSGDEKAMGNVQLRLNLFTSHLAGKPQDWGLDAGVDAGWARQPGFAPIRAAGVAAGFRFVWDRAILLRVEMGQALERGGDQTLYVAFGEQF
jgi:hypothetical protein